MGREEKIVKIVNARNIKTAIRPRKKNKEDTLRYKIRHIFFIILIMALFSIIYIWLGFKYTQMGYEVSRLKKKEIALKELNRKLRLEISVLRSPQRLEKIAKEKFGLKHPDTNQIIILK